MSVHEDPSCFNGLDIHIALKIKKKSIICYKKMLLGKLKVRLQTTITQKFIFCMADGGPLYKNFISLNLCV